MAATVLRLTRHRSQEEPRIRDLTKIYGEVEIVNVDVPYGSDPVAAIREVLPPNCVAIEFVGPMPVLTKLIDKRNGIGLPVLRAEFLRGEDGRAVIAGTEPNGRDILAFGHYTIVERVEIKTRPLLD